MPVKEENKVRFISAMFELVRTIKNESEISGKLCGGLNEKELFIILFVGQNKNVKMSDIADGLEAPLSTLTSIVDKLVEKKYLLRDHSVEDRRIVNVSLTPNGKKAYKISLDRKQIMAEKVLTQFNEKEQDTFIEHLNKLAASISSKK
ncbi:MAG: MarR family transcriptional regulator [Bacteroidota bacterium]|nr:MarR family transcriptional regulator [Bacteroidota bacterium]MDP4244520.1 MarR family transcriptional regulator [Bacteroidota bacterium]